MLLNYQQRRIYAEIVETQQTLEFLPLGRRNSEQWRYWPPYGSTFIQSEKNKTAATGFCQG